MPTTKKVLVIEDSKLIRLQVRNILEKYGVEVFELNNADDFFSAAWHQREFNLLILDINLPGMSGLNALERMSQDKLLAYLPVIVLSGYSEKSTVQKALQMGAVNFIRKPFSPEDLLERVEQVLGPIVLPETESIVSLEAEMRKEINRAKRGNTLISFLEIQFPVGIRSIDNVKELAKIKDELRGTLREIDSIFVTQKRNILAILPFTGSYDISVVIGKFRKKLDEMESVKGKLIQTATATFPDDGTDERRVLAVLEERMRHPGD